MGIREYCLWKNMSSQWSILLDMNSATLVKSENDKWLKLVGLLFRVVHINSLASILCEICTCKNRNENIFSDVLV